MKNSNTISSTDILSVAKKHFDTKGFEQTTNRDITRDLGIQDDILLQHFKSLDEILEVLWSGSLKNLRNEKVK